MLDLSKSQFCFCVVHNFFSDHLLRSSILAPLNLNRFASIVGTTNGSTSCKLCLLTLNILVSWLDKDKPHALMLITYAVARIGFLKMEKTSKVMTTV